MNQSHVARGSAWPARSPRTAGRRPVGLRLPAVAGAAYVVAWVTGLAVWPSNVDVAAAGREVLAAYRDHQAAAQVQYALVEGVAAVALAAVVLALGAESVRRGSPVLGKLLVVGGLSAAGVSLIQCALGQHLAASVVPSGNAERAGSLLGLIDRLDGAKMLLLALTALVAAVLVRQVRLLPRWLGWSAVLLAVALMVSGLGYLLLNGTLATAASVSLALLLLWVCAAGVVVGTTRQQAHS